MAPTNQCLAAMARMSLFQSSRPMSASIPRFLLPFASQAQLISQNQLKFKKPPMKKEERPKHYKDHKVPENTQFSLCDAMR